MARILLSGANGFVGAAILRHLLSRGHEIAALHSGRPPSINAARLTWYRADLLAADHDELAALVEQIGASHCIHAAWYTNHTDYLVAEINRDWVAASLRLAESFYAAGGDRFVGLGTCLEYDQRRANGRFSEEAPILPDTLYARSKAEVCAKLAKLAQSEGRSFAWARIFYVYGPADRPTRLIPYVLDNLRAGKRVSPRFGGLMRDYIHVDDLAAQIGRIACGDVAGAINTGTGRAVRLVDVFRTAGMLMGRPDLVDPNDALDANQSWRIEADMLRFEHVLGPVEVRALHDGLAGMMDRP